MKQITFIAREDEVDGGYAAHAHWPDGNRDIFTEGDSRDELLGNIREAIDASFEPDDARPQLILLHFVRDEAVAV